MKNFLLLPALLIFIVSINAQARWVVQAGGTPDSSTPAPYFSPQHLTIEQGDTVFWDNIQGFHDITKTSGPEDFSYGPAGSGWTHEYVFNTIGVYEYECSVNDHGLTQFGSITVVDPNVSNVNALWRQGLEVNLYPNPTTSTFFVNWNADNDLPDVYLQVFDFLGRPLFFQSVKQQGMPHQVDLSGFSNGVYKVSLLSNEKLIWNSSLLLTNK